MDKIKNDDKMRASLTIKEVHLMHTHFEIQELGNLIFLYLLMDTLLPEFMRERARQVADCDFCSDKLKQILGCLNFSEHNVPGSGLEWIGNKSRMLKAAVDKAVAEVEN